ncbi:MAG: thermonuclease family protein [Litorivicinus sp.]
MTKTYKHALIVAGFAAWVAIDRSGMLDAPAAPGFQGVVTGPARVVDGDSLAIGETQIRLFGIDAPEGQQRCRDARGRAYDCGERATGYLKSLIGRDSVSCVEQDRDAYGRRVSVCHAGAGELNALMVQAGHAVAYRRYTDRYAADEAMARDNRAGLWAGDFERPERWRADRR